MSDRAALTALEAECRRWRAVHPRCRAAVIDQPDVVGMTFRIEGVANSVREISFVRSSVSWPKGSKILAGHLAALWPSTMRTYAPMLAAVGKKA
jgi:hypothetical protein